MLAEFKKYPEIENSYRERFINDFFNRHPEALSKKFSVTEKIDGSNISFIFTWNNLIDDYDIKYAKRSAIIFENESFFDIHQTVQRDDIQLFLTSFKMMLKDNYSMRPNVCLHGEYFGPGIQKRINYGLEKSFVFFDISINGKFINQCNFQLLMNKTISYNPTKNILKFIIPTLGVFQFADALKYNTHFNSILGPKFEELTNECEGIVIKPWDFGEDYLDQYGHSDIFYIKIKNEKFSEKAKIKYKKPGESKSSELIKIQEVFEQYLTENRLCGIFSKEGMIQTTKDIGHYIKLMIDDAKNDFMKDNSEMFLSEKLSDKERGKVFSNGGKIIVPMLMKHL